MLDVPLNALGSPRRAWSATSWHARLRSPAVICSDLVRTRETAQPLDRGDRALTCHVRRPHPRAPLSVCCRAKPTLSGGADAEAAWHATTPAIRLWPRRRRDWARGFLERCVNAITDMVTACDEKTLVPGDPRRRGRARCTATAGPGFHSASTWSCPNVNQRMARRICGRRAGLLLRTPTSAAASQGDERRMTNDAAT